MTLFLFGISLLGMMAGVVLLILGFIKKKKLKGGIVIGVSVLLFFVSLLMPAPEGSKEKVEVASKTQEELNKEKEAEQAKKEEEKKALEEKKAKEEEMIAKKEEKEAKIEEERKAKEAKLKEEQAAKAKAEKEAKEKAEANKQKTETKPEKIQTTTKENSNVTLANEAKKVITDKLGKKNNQKKDTVKSYAVTEEGNGKAFIVELNANENFTVNMTKKGMWMDSKKILELLNKKNEFEKIIIHWYYPLIDTYGNEKDVLVMSFNINKATLNKIKWDNFLTDNVPNVVDNYFEHAALKE
ncbi:outer membrane biosynthesis protein TonB [Lysinibacillus parviboronicapiens]|uniref:Outer membrane biosynthesis protein TonB n=1 Tax=Lysinibacillus parviboronicapiens TaxID=436516 RepID=A0ABV2PIH0_9BACI